MPTSTNVTNLKINELTEAQYDTAVQGGIIGANEISILTDAEAGQVIQVATLPTASADELGNIYQFVGTTNANYTNGYFYKCVSDGATPAVYSWTTIEVQAGGGLPSQTGNAGKFLTTDGTDASWGTTISEPLSVINTANADTASLTLGNGADSTRYFKIIPSYVSQNVSLYFGLDLVGSFNKFSFVPGNSIYGFRIGSSGSKITYIYAEHINNGGDITVPTVAGEMAVQVSTVPTADSILEGKIYQYIGATDSTYTNGHFYKCVSDGQDPATYSWAEVSMGGGGSSYTAGTGIDITSGVISVTSPTLTNVATGNNSIMIGATSELNRTNCVVIGVGAHNKAFASSTVIVGQSATGSTGCVAIGANTENTSPNSIAIGYSARTSTQNAIQLNCSGNAATNSDSNTFKVANTNGNYEMMSADGTIPTARLTKVNSTITLTAAGWSSNTQTVNVTGMTADGVVMVSPDPTDQSAYTSAGVLCTAQAAGTLTFTCDTVPSGDLSVNVVML